MASGVDEDSFENPRQVAVEKQQRLYVDLSDGRGSVGAMMLTRFSDSEVAVDR